MEDYVRAADIAKELSRETVCAELERILASQTFRPAEAQKRFLRYVVEQALAGRSRQIKEFAIGSEVFERGSSFDPRIDNIVRVEARKLRVRLARYYESEGAHNPVRIVLPQRGYVPAFQVNPGPTPKPAAGTALPGSVPSRTRRVLMVAAEALVLTSIVGVILWYSRHKTAASTLESPSIAVLPFRDLGAVNDDSFSDGLADELIDSLGSIPGLRVVARTSAFQFKSGGVDIREIGKRLNVKIILEGSVRQYGDQLRISVQMDDAANGFRLWSASYDRDSRDALAAQREISSAIVTTLERQFPVLTKSSRSVGPDAPVDPEAYRDYLRGIYFWNKNTSAGHQAAISYLQRAVAREPDYARAYAALARCYVGLPSFSLMSAREAVPKVREFARNALALDGNLGEANVYLAYAAMLSYDWSAAEREFETGLRLEPGNAVAHRWYANFLLAVGQADKALTENRIAESLDPVSPYVMAGTARALHLLGQDDESIAQANKILLLDPHFAVAHQALAEAYMQKKMYSEAITELKLAGEESGHDPTRTAALAYAYAISGQPAEARRLLETLVASHSRAFPAKYIAEVYIGLGDHNRAFEFLTRAIEEQENGVLLKLDPVYKDLRSDPRFRTLLAGMRLQ